MAIKPAADEWAFIAARVAELRKEQDADLARVASREEPVVDPVPPSKAVASYGERWGCPDLETA
jgi:hypothetical protein